MNSIATLERGRGPVAPPEGAVITSDICCALENSTVGYYAKYSIEYATPSDTVENSTVPML